MKKFLGFLLVLAIATTAQAADTYQRVFDNQKLDASVSVGTAGYREATVSIQGYGENAASGGTVNVYVQATDTSGRVLVATYDSPSTVKMFRGPVSGVLYVEITGFPDAGDPPEPQNGIDVEVVLK